MNKKLLDEMSAKMFPQWFVNDQAEKEKNATDILENLKLTGESGDALLMIDHGLAQRKAD